MEKIKDFINKHSKIIGIILISFLLIQTCNKNRLINKTIKKYNKLTEENIILEDRNVLLQDSLNIFKNENRDSLIFNEGVVWGIQLIVDDLTLNNITCNNLRKRYVMWRNDFQSKINKSKKNI